MLSSYTGRDTEQVPAHLHATPDFMLLYHKPSIGLYVSTGGERVEDCLVSVHGFNYPG